MISKRVGNGDEIGLDRTMYFPNEGVMGVDFFGIENTGKSLLIFIKVHSGVVFIKREPFPFTEDGELFRLQTLFEFQQAQPVHTIKWSRN